MNRANIEMKSLLKAEKIAYWEIADVLGVCENTIGRKLRKELSDSDTKAFWQAIEAIKAKKETV